LGLALVSAIVNALARASAGVEYSTFFFFSLMS